MIAFDGERLWSALSLLVVAALEATVFLSFSLFAEASLPSAATAERRGAADALSPRESTSSVRAVAA